MQGSRRARRSCLFQFLQRPRFDLDSVLARECRCASHWVCAPSLNSSREGKRSAMFARAVLFIGGILSESAVFTRVDRVGCAGVVVYNWVVVKVVSNNASVLLRTVPQKATSPEARATKQQARLKSPTLTLVNFTSSTDTCTVCDYCPCDIHTVRRHMRTVCLVYTKIELHSAS